MNICVCIYHHSNGKPSCSQRQNSRQKWWIFSASFLQILRVLTFFTASEAYQRFDYFDSLEIVLILGPQLKQISIILQEPSSRGYIICRTTLLFGSCDPQYQCISSVINKHRVRYVFIIGWNYNSRVMWLLGHVIPLWLAKWRRGQSIGKTYQYSASRVFQWAIGLYV